MNAPGKSTPAPTRLAFPEAVTMAVLQALPAAFYSVQELAEMWHRRPASIRWWLLFLRRNGQGPTRLQVERKRVGQHLWVLYRADYVKLVEESFLSRARAYPRNDSVYRGAD